MATRFHTLRVESDPNAKGAMQHMHSRYFLDELELRGLTDVNYEASVGQPLKITLTLVVEKIVQVQTPLASGVVGPAVDVDVLEAEDQPAEEDYNPWEDPNA